MRNRIAIPDRNRKSGYLMMNGGVRMSELYLEGFKDAYDMLDQCFMSDKMVKACGWRHKLGDLVMLKKNLTDHRQIRKLR